MANDNSILKKMILLCQMMETILNHGGLSSFKAMFSTVWFLEQQHLAKNCLSSSKLSNLWAVSYL